MSFEPEPGRTYLRFHFDTNCINARGKLAAMNRLEVWSRDGTIELMMPQPAREEAIADGNSARRSKANEYIFTMTHAETPDEMAMLQRLAATIFPKGFKKKNDEIDVEIVFNAQKNGGILVTTDGGSKSQPGGILGAQEALAALGIRVVTPEQACDLVEERLALNRRLAEQRLAMKRRR